MSCSDVWRIFMKINNTILVAAISCLVLFTAQSCDHRANITANEEQQLDSVSIARNAANENTLQDLKIKRDKAEQRAAEAKISMEKAEEIERDANDAAKQADRAYMTEKKAQRTRNEAIEQAKKSDKANNKSQQN